MRSKIFKIRNISSEEASKTANPTTDSKKQSIKLSESP